MSILLITDEISQRFEDSRPEFLFVAPETVRSALQAAKRANLKQKVVVSGQYPGCIPISDLLADDGTLYPENTVTDVREHVATIPYSSGTTGLPKGVLITHYNMVAMLMIRSHPDVTAMSDETEEQDVCLSFLPFFHAYGLSVLMIAELIAGAKQIIMPRFEPERFLQLIEKYKVTSIPLVPPVVIFMVKSPLVKKYDISSVKRVHCGAAPLAKDIYEEFRTLLKISGLTQGYGMTETTVGCSVAFASRPTKSESCGLLLPNMEMQIVDPETKAILGANERGEIWVKGPNIMKGYLNKPEATKETIDEDGWLHTGDIGYYDEEGYLYIVDRLKELIKYKGFQVAPAELESLILNHPDVADVAVVGIPDVEAGELPKAFVVKKAGSNITAADVMQYVTDNVASFKWLRGGVEFVNTIPKSQAGKILRKELRQRGKQSKI